MEVAKYFYENRSLVLNAYHSISRDVLEEYIKKNIFPLVDLYFQENYAGNSIPQQDRQFIVDLYTFGIAGYFLRWINSGMKNIPYDMMNQLFRFFTGTMEGMAQHSKLESSHT